MGNSSGWAKVKELIGWWNGSVLLLLLVLCVLILCCVVANTLLKCWKSSNQDQTKTSFAVVEFYWHCLMLLSSRECTTIIFNSIFFIHFLQFSTEQSRSRSIQSRQFSRSFFTFSRFRSMFITDSVLLHSTCQTSQNSHLASCYSWRLETLRDKHKMDWDSPWIPLFVVIDFLSPLIQSNLLINSRKKNKFHSIFKISPIKIRSFRLHGQTFQSKCHETEAHNWIAAFWRDERDVLSMMKNEVKLQVNELMNHSFFILLLTHQHDRANTIHFRNQHSSNGNWEKFYKKINPTSHASWHIL